MPKPFFKKKKKTCVHLQCTVTCLKYMCYKLQCMLIYREERSFIQETCALTQAYLAMIKKQSSTDLEETAVARTANSPQLLYSSLSLCWCLVAGWLHLVASLLMASWFLEGETPWWWDDLIPLSLLFLEITSL